MRAYDRGEEEKVRLLRMVREWTHAGLLDSSQHEVLERDLRVDLRRTGLMLRLGLALFTSLVVAAAAGLVVVFFDISGDAALALTCGLGGVISLVAADRLAVRFRFYRHGVEEALAVAACVCVALSAVLATKSALGFPHESTAIVLALLVGAACSWFVYLRFGFQYAAIGSLVCLAVTPLQWSIEPFLARSLCVAVFACGFAAADTAGRGASNGVAADDAVVVRAAAFAGAYLAANLYLTHAIAGGMSPLVGGWFRWTTYAAIWMLPVAGLWRGIREKERWLLDAGAAALLLTLVSNKPYLGLVQRPWDPILLGGLLLGIAIVLRRWLAHGADGQRRGFTAVQILASDRDLIRVVAMASAVTDIRPELPANHPSDSAFQGGRSGGGGGGAGF